MKNEISYKSLTSTGRLKWVEELRKSQAEIEKKNEKLVSQKMFKVV